MDIHLGKGGKTVTYDCCTQIPRFAFEKFPGAKAELTTQMKSVGEAMAIGRTFQESFQKVNLHFREPYTYPSTKTLHIPARYHHV